MVDIDLFTAQEVIERMRCDHYIQTIHDSDAQKLIVDNAESQAVTMLQERDGLTQTGD